MKADRRFLFQPKAFWASVRLISQQVGYTNRITGKIKIPNVEDIQTKLEKFQIDLPLLHSQVLTGGNFENLLSDYFLYRADIINTYVEPRLMKAPEARHVFEQTRQLLNPTCPLPLNKQKGIKKAPAYLTGIVNMLIEANAKGLPCDYDPHQLTMVTKGGLPVRTLARRVDGAFPRSINPIAIWEIKEYYYTTTFGSRIADGVYESLLDGMELEELKEHEGTDIKHYLMVDAYETWWNQGKSYLCRIIDMLHMGYIDEVLFGREVMERLPNLVKDWVKIYNSR